MEGLELIIGVYVFPQTIERESSTNTVHPAAVETPKGVILIDTGYAQLTDQIKGNLAEAGFDWDDVLSVVLTH